MKGKLSIGIGLNLCDAHAVLLDRHGKVVTEVERKRSKVTANETIEVLIELVDAIMEKSKKFSKDIGGMGLALGGIIDNKRGLVHWPQKKDSSYVYISVPLKKYLETKFKFPVLLENDASASAWAEYVRFYQDKYRNLLYMYSGVGCGMVLDGKLYRGKDGAAGELFVNPHRVMRSSLGDFSFLSQWPADLGVVKRMKEEITLGRATSLIKKISPTGDISFREILLAAKNNDRLACKVLKEAAFSLGVKISFLVNLLNPEVVVIGGGLEEAGTFFLDEVWSVVKKFAFQEMTSHLKISFSRLKEKATSIGAALRVFF